MQGRARPEEHFKKTSLTLQMAVNEARRARDQALALAAIGDPFPRVVPKDMGKGRASRPMRA